MKKDIILEKESFELLELTQSICPACKKTVPAEVRVRDDRVYMFKTCLEHGEYCALISSDRNIYEGAKSFNHPGKKPKAFATSALKGCPEDCGICPSHQQHTCLALLEVTDGCNISCANCYAGSRGSSYLDMDTINFMLDKYVSYEGSPEVLQISGGEPTLHPQLLKIIRLAQSKKIRHVMLNTNGIRLVEDKKLAKELAKADIELYLQFDGFDPATYERLRGGKEILKLKLAALETIAEAHIPTTLVATLEKGLNENQIGPIIDYSLKNRFVRGITFQPSIYLRDDPGFDPMDRMTLPDVLKEVEIQTRSVLKVSDFVPLPCPYPTCCSLTYAFLKGSEVIPVTRKIKVEKYLDCFCNQIITSPSLVLKQSLEKLWSASATLENKDILRDFSLVCGMAFRPGILNELKNSILRIMVKPFMDAYTFDFKRARKCCIHVLQTDGRMIPFCVYNNLFRNQKAR
jgi:7,8-dihydro-6-hydroxymethylpterin dimethyltransferase